MACDGKPHLRLGPPQGMSTYPEVSVVMSVYNGASHLAATLDSILSQEGVELEFIVVNDGSTDESGRDLESTMRSATVVCVLFIRRIPA